MVKNFCVVITFSNRGEMQISPKRCLDNEILIENSLVVSVEPESLSHDPHCVL